MRKIIASLDIGSSSTKLIVGEYIKNKLNILCVSEVPSHGIKKGLITKEEDFVPILKEIFHKSEEMVGLPIKEVVLGIPAYYTESFITEGTSVITNEEHVVMQDDLIRAMHSATYNKIDANRSLVSVVPTRYKVDEEIVKNPLRVIGNKLTIKAVVITSPKSLIDSFLKVLDRIGKKVVDVVTTSLADYATFRTKEYDSTVGAVVNLGENMTTVSIINKGILMKSEIIDLGGSSIDHDISYIYKITKKDARELKENIGLAVTDLASDAEKMILTDRMGESVTITQKALSEIIESRLEEILELVKKQINLLTKKEIEYIIFTGGTSELGDFHILLDKVFTKPHILGKIDTVGVRNNKYSSAIGIIKYYNGKLKLQKKEYSLWDVDDLEVLSGVQRRVNINEKSILGKLFGYFFDS